MSENNHEIVDKKLGEKGQMDLDFNKDTLELEFKITLEGVEGVKAGVHVSVDADVFADKLAKAIPGTLDDMVIASLKAGMKA